MPLIPGIGRTTSPPKEQETPAPRSALASTRVEIGQEETIPPKESTEGVKSNPRSRGVTLGSCSIVSVGSRFSSGADSQETLVQPWQECRREHFKAIEYLGRGGFGEVKLVHYLHDDNLYALKSIEKSLIHERRIGGDDKVVDAVMAERDFGVLSRQWDCPFIIKLFATFQSAAKFHFVFEFCPGGDLMSLLCAQESSRFEEVDARFYIGQLTLALAHLHTHDVIHRDVKLENALLAKNGYLKLADFGCVRAELPVGGTKSFVHATEPSIFMPPEFRRGELYGKELDCWQLGVASCAMITGEYPTSAKRAMPQSQPGVSPSAAKFYHELLCEERKKRLGYPDGAGMARSHSFFQDLDWDALLSLTLPPPFECQEEPSSRGGLSMMHLKSTNCRKGTDLIRLRCFSWAAGPDGSGAWCGQTDNEASDTEDDI